MQHHDELQCLPQIPRRRELERSRRLNPANLVTNFCRKSRMYTAAARFLFVCSHPKLVNPLTKPSAMACRSSGSRAGGRVALGVNALIFGWNESQTARGRKHGMAQFNIRVVADHGGVATKGRVQVRPSTEHREAQFEGR